MRGRNRSGDATKVSVPDHVTYIEIRQAILRRDFVLEFLPKVSLRSGLIESVEALVRWQHGTRGRLSPERFLPEAERTALMGRLTTLVLEKAVSRCISFHREGVLVGITVNLSPSVLSDAGLPDQVGEVLERHGLNASWLTLDITQSAGIADLVRAATILQTMRSTGVHLTLDDFGAGAFSQSYLRELPFDEVKIDRSLIARVGTSPVDARIVRSAVEMAHGLNMRVVAEGVEDEPTLALLHALRVDAAQGYFLSPPVEAEDFLEQFHSIASKAREHAFSPSNDLRRISRALDEVVTRLPGPNAR